RPGRVHLHALPQHHGSVMPRVLERLGVGALPHVVAGAGAGPMARRHQRDDHVPGAAIGGGESGPGALRQGAPGGLPRPPHDLPLGVGKPLRMRAANLMTTRITGGGVTGKQRTGWPLTASGWVTSSPGEEPAY